MNNMLSNAFIFSIGSAFGVVLSWKYLKTKYRKIADEEIESVKQTFSKKFEDNCAENLKEEGFITDGEKQILYSRYKDDYRELIQSTEYIDAEEAKEIAAPYIIRPEEYGDIEGYNIVSLVLYSDNILADYIDNIIDDVDDTVGEESLLHFGEYEDDSVFVRNDRLKSDYEILRDTRKYSEVVGDDIAE